jgi:hypothetical protein
LSRQKDPFHPRTNILKILDAVKYVATSFSLEGPNAVQFMIAYIFDGTVTRGPHRLPKSDETLYSNGFWRDHLYSTRAATMSRDYIFATMPQFQWYHYPKAAETMDFDDIFADLRAQALAHGRNLRYRFLRGMVDPQLPENGEYGWLPATNVPEPRSLGDFLKLFRSESLDASRAFCAEQLSMPVKIRPLADDFFKNPEAVLDVVETSMIASRNIWSASQKGELSQFGSWPEDNLDEMPRQMLEAYKEGSTPEAQSDYIKGIVASYEGKLATAEARMLSDEWLLPQARKVLSNFWGSLDPSVHDPEMTGNWYSFRREMKEAWPPKLLSTVVLLAAMVSCQFPLSSANWTRDRFAVVGVDLGHSMVLALVAQHAVSEETEKDMLVVFGHADHDRKLVDAIITEPSKNVPVGSFPCIEDKSQLGLVA